MTLNYSLHIVHNSYSNLKAALIAYTNISTLDSNCLPTVSKQELQCGIIHKVGQVILVQYCGKFLLRKKA